MALSSIKDFWIHPNALTITLNYFGDQQLIQTSMLAGAVIMAYNKDHIGYDAALNFRRWKLQAFPTQLNDTCAYYIHAELSRDGDTAMIIYSPVKRDIEGMAYLGKDDNGKEQWDTTTKSDKSWFIYLGEISASTDSDGATVDRVWLDGLHTGTLATDQYRMEEAAGDWVNMFQLVNDNIKVLKPIVEATINALTVAKNFIFGGKTFTSTAGESDSGIPAKRNDATLPTTGYVAKEIESLDEHFLIKDGDEAQSVGGDVTFVNNVTISGDSSVGNDQSVSGNQSIAGNQTIQGTQKVEGSQILHQGFETATFFNSAGQTTGAQLTSEGILTAAGIIANSLTIKEFIYNVIRAQGGEYQFSPSVKIEKCLYYMTDGRTLFPDHYYAESLSIDDIDYIEITLRDDECTHRGNPLEEGDIVYGYVNKIGDSGQYAQSGQCFMYVESIDGLTITAKLYENGEEGVVGNIPPTDGMTIAQRGTRNPEKANRMTSFYLSAETGALIMLDKVTSPTLSAENFGTSYGKLPKSLYDDIQSKYTFLKETDPVVYGRYGIFENILQFDHRGQIIKTQNYRGEWDTQTAKENPYRVTVTTYDVVTHNGTLWECKEDNTQLAPSTDNSDWGVLVSGSSTMIYTIEPSVTGIHLNREGVLNTTTLDVWVNAYGESYTRIDDQYELNQLGLSVWYSIDNADKRTQLIVGTSGVIEVEEGGSIVVAEDVSTADEIIITLEGENIDISKIDEKINLHLIKDANEDGYGEELNKIYIPVTKDGKQGQAGPSIYLNGTWEAGKIYKKENNCVPIVLHKGIYYILTAFESIDVEPDSLNGWDKFQHFQYLFSEFLMTEKARFGTMDGGIFNNGWLFSSKKNDGTEWNGEEISDAGSFPDRSLPMLALNFKTGLIHANDANIQGVIKAKSGNIGNFEIEDGQIKKTEVSVVERDKKYTTGLTINTEYIRYENNVAENPDNRKNEWAILLGKSASSLGLHLRRYSSDDVTVAPLKPQLYLESSVGQSKMNGVSIKAQGAIISETSIISQGRQMWNNGEYNTLSIENGTDVFMYNNASNDWYLPTVEDTNRYFPDRNYCVAFTLSYIPYQNTNSASATLIGGTSEEGEVDGLYYEKVCYGGTIKDRQNFNLSLTVGNTYIIRMFSRFMDGKQDVTWMVNKIS